MNRTLLALAACAALLAPPPARADAIDPGAPRLVCPVLTCPPGSRAAALGHSSCPSICAPTEPCATAADCVTYYGSSARCEPTRFCVGTVYAGHGMSASVLDACAPDGPCGTGGAGGTAGGPSGEAPTCQEVSRCVAPPAPTSPASGCAARGGSRRAQTSPGVLALALGARCLARRAARRPRRLPATY